MIAWIGIISCHLQSLLGAIELIVLCAFMCKVGYFDAQIKKTLLYKEGGGVDLLASLGKRNYLFTQNKSMKQLPLLIISSTPSLKTIAHISSHSYWPNQIISTLLHTSTLFVKGLN